MFTKELKNDIDILTLFTGSALSNRKLQFESHQRTHLTLINIENKNLSE